jgi:hypothetical protein
MFSGPSDAGWPEERPDCRSRRIRPEPATITGQNLGSRELASSKSLR